MYRSENHAQSGGNQAVTGNAYHKAKREWWGVHAYNAGGGYYVRTGLGLCNAQLCTIMHDYAQCIRRRHKGIANKRDPGTANLLSFGSRRGTTFFLIFRRLKNFIVLQSIFSSGNKCRCILVDKIFHDKHNNELHWTRVKQNIMHDYAQSCQSAKLYIMHNYAQLCTCINSLRCTMGFGVHIVMCPIA